MLISSRFQGLAVSRLGAATVWRSPCPRWMVIAAKQRYTLDSLRCWRHRGVFGRERAAPASAGGENTGQTIRRRVAPPRGRLVWKRMSRRCMPACHLLRNAAMCCFAPLQREEGTT